MLFNYPPRYVKVKPAKLIAEDNYSIDLRVPHQEGCIVFSPKYETEFIGLFKQFGIVDYGRYERALFFNDNIVSEHYLVARKR